MEFLESVFSRIDAVNREDPRRITDPATGAQDEQEIVYSRRMTVWLEKLEAAPSVALRIAVYAQHIGRFRRPRSTFPDGRTGYLQWKTALLQYHAELCSEILRECGAEQPLIERTARLIRKQGLGRDPETQTLEDCACLVFLELFFDEFAPTQSAEKMKEIVEKTLKRMSGRAVELARSLPAFVRAAALLG